MHGAIDRELLVAREVQGRVGGPSAGRNAGGAEPGVDGRAALAHVVPAGGVDRPVGRKEARERRSGVVSANEVAGEGDLVEEGAVEAVLLAHIGGKAVRSGRAGLADPDALDPHGGPCQRRNSRHAGGRLGDCDQFGQRIRGLRGWVAV